MLKPFLGIPKPHRGFRRTWTQTTRMTRSLAKKQPTRRRWKPPSQRCRAIWSRVWRMNGPHCTRSLICQWP